MYSEANPMRLVGYFNDEGTLYLIRTEIEEHPPHRLPILIGEWAHNLRSALDQVAWELVEMNGGVPSRKTQFPILDFAPTKDGVRVPLRVKAKTGGVSEDVLTLIERAQPYSHGDDPTWHPLSLLAEINNCDKHRTLMLGSPWLTKGSVAVLFGTSGLRGDQSFDGHFKNGAVVAQFEITPAELMAAGCMSTDEVHVEGTGSISIAFDEIRPPETNDVLETIKVITPLVEQLILVIDAAVGGRLGTTA